MSHNSKYYTKKLRKDDGKACKKIDTFFKAADCTVSGASASDASTSQTSGDQEIESHEAARGDLNHNNMDTSISTTETERVVQHDADSAGSDDSDSGSSASESTMPSISLVPTPDQRKFASDRYERLFPWLYYSVAKTGYICKYCELFSSESGAQKDVKFCTKGVILGTHPTRKLSKHSECDRHKKAEEKYVKAKETIFRKQGGQLQVDHMLRKTEDFSNTEMFSKTKERNRSVLKKLFQICYFIIRKKWAQANFEEVVRFVASLGVDDLKEHLENCPSFATYLSSTTVTELINILGEFIEIKLLRDLRSCDFYTLMADESTDDANREQLSVYAKYVDKNFVFGDPDSKFITDHYLGIIHVDRTDAESLMTALEQFLVAKEIDITRCRFVAFDGCNTMSGEVSGLQRRFRNKSPKSIYVNCRNHRLALCLKHLMKEYNLLVQVDSALLAIWKLFHYSPQRFSVFQKVQESYGQTPLTLVRAATTRWLSHGKACIRFSKRYVQILDTLDEIYDLKKEPEVFGLRMILTQRNVVAMVLLLCDVLRPVNFLSLYLQDPHICFTSVDARVKATINELTELIPLLQNLDETTYFSKVTDFFEEISDRVELQRRMRNQRDITPAEFLRTVGIPFIYSLIGEITDAFLTSPVLKSFSALDPRDLPDQVQELGNHGLVQLEVLNQHYGNVTQDTFRGTVSQSLPDINAAQASVEYQGFRHQMFLMRQGQDCRYPHDLLKRVLMDGNLKACFANVCKLLELLCIVPVSTASVERGFSLMNSICTPLRNRLTQAALDNIMRICSEGPKELTDTDLEELVNISGTRRTDLLCYKTVTVLK